MKRHLNDANQDSRPFSGYLFVSLALLCFCTSHVFALSDYQSKQITNHLNHPKMKEDTSIFDGKQFVTGVSAAKVNAYYKGYMDQLKRATRGMEYAFLLR